MLTPIWGSLVIFLICPLLGGLPLINWITYACTGHWLSKLGTGNMSVSAAFYHGGKLVGILAVLSEAFKGIAAVLLARAFFSDPVWELVALMSLVMGRYWMGKSAGTTNVVWGIIVHDPIAAGLIFLIGGISFTIFRDRTSGRLGVLILLAVILTLRHPHQPEYIMMAIALASLLSWIYQKIPDDLDLPAKDAKVESQKVFHFFRGDKTIISLNNPLDARKVGQKAANLSQLKRWGYDVPDGWVLCPGDDPQPFLDFLEPSVEQPLVVRSSAIGEDSQLASAAGQYQTILHITSREALQQAILTCQTSYHSSTALQYRRHREQQEAGMAIIIQKQIKGVFSGVAFSRDPINQLNTGVLIEALPGDATRVVSGKVTPEQYQVDMETRGGEDGETRGRGDTETRGGEDGEIEVTSYGIGDSQGDLPPGLIQLVATIAREIEVLYHGIPQDIEWTYDGQQLWLLQSRPITNLHPIWTRKIAAEVIPGLIRPLTWSINRPLTCGVWGDIFTLVLGNRAKGLDFTQTATLHYQRAYFNATLLGEIFLRMGLPPESLEFLTRGAKFTKPPLLSTLRNLPGLLRLLRRERNLERDFSRDKRHYFQPTLSQLVAKSPEELSDQDLLERIETILSVLKRATYYSILAPLSFALRQAIWKVPDTALDNSQTPEVESLRSLADLADNARNLLSLEQLKADHCDSVFAYLAETPEGKAIVEQFQQWLERYGYLSQVATDIAVPRWQEDSRTFRELFTQFLMKDIDSEKGRKQKTKSSIPSAFLAKLVQRRLNLKSQVTEVYSQLLAHLRWSFIALANNWTNLGLLSTPEEIFLLKFSEIRHLIEQSDGELREQLSQRIKQRQIQLQRNQQIPSVPYVVYGNPTASTFIPSTANLSPKQQLQGIGASPGQVEGRVKILRNLQEMTNIDSQTILVVPYTDSGWAAILARAGGIIAEVGGRLSHGAIIAREYGIPAVMDIHHATELLRDGQRVRLDGQTGTVDILK